MESSIKHIIISVGKGAWYPEGVERLERSLNYHGFTGHVKTWKRKLPTGSPMHIESPYAFKVKAFEWAVANGYTHIMWLDASSWALKNPDIIFDIINEKGHYFWGSGHNCAQTCNDKSLEYFGISRDVAETYHDLSSGLVGLNMNNERSAQFLQKWIAAERDGIFKGSREHDGQSQDPRFCFHRQDQSCASIIANQLGMEIDQPNILCGYYGPNMPESLVMCYKGM
jgi:hypothetical protein